MSINTLNYTGKVTGAVQPNKNGTGSHFEGTIGQLPIWLFGRAGEQAGKLIGKTALATGILNSRVTDKGNHFLSPVIFSVLPANSSEEHNLVAFEGVINSTRKIKDGLYSVGIEIDASTWDSTTKARVQQKQVIPVSTSNITDSDIGKAASVVGEIAVRQGKFIDVVPQAFTIEGVDTPEEEADDSLDGLL